MLIKSNKSFGWDSVTCMNDLPSGKFPDYNHNKYGSKPGQLWSADEQCRILLRDKAAMAFYASNADLAVIQLHCNFIIFLCLPYNTIHLTTRDLVIQ